MLCLARDLLFKVRFATNCNPAAKSRLSYWRNYYANLLNFGKVIPSKTNFVPSGDGKFLDQSDFINAYSQVVLDEPTISNGLSYWSVIYKALEIEALKALKAGAYVLDLSDGIDAAVEEVFAYFKCTRRMIHSPKEVAQAAIAAANGDTELGNFIAEGIHKVGKHGLFVIDRNEKPNNEVEFVNAFDVANRKKIYMTEEMRDRVFCSPYFFTNKRDKICLLENPLILVLVNKIVTKNVIQAVQQAVRPGSRTQPRPLLIIAEDVKMGLEGSLMLDGSCPRKKLCVFKHPKDLFENQFTWREVMEDLAILTGGQVVTGEFDMNLIPQMLGSCKKVRVSNGLVLIYDAAGNQESIEKRCKQLKSTIKLTRPLLDLEIRLQHLSPAVRFKVGEAFNLDRVYFVGRDTQQAMKVGILPGGGVAYLSASKELEKIQISHPEKRLGVQLLQNALKMPVYHIASTAGVDGLAVVEKLLEQNNPNLGYNPTTGEYIEMIESGFIDKTDRLIAELETAIKRFKNTFDIGTNYYLLEKHGIFRVGW